MPLYSYFPRTHPFFVVLPLLVDSHPARQLRLHVVEANTIRIRLLDVSAWLQEVLLQARVEVAHADEGISDCENDEQDSQNSESRQTPPHGQVEITVPRLIDSDELEEKVGKTTEVQDDDAPHARLRLVSGEEGGHQQNGNRDGNGSNGKTEFHVRLAADDNEELDGEADEEEEIELQQCDIDLYRCVLVLRGFL